MNDEFIFVCGPGHSGTTLMLALLDSHSDISAIKDETGLFHRVHDDEQALEALSGWREKFRLTGRIIAEKTPVHVRYIDRINRLVPTAKFIIMVRDGRDAVLSAQHRLVDHPRGGFAAATLEWRSNTRAALQHQALPNALLVKYEDLVSALEPTLREVCSFLGIAFEPAMLEHHKSERRWWDKEVRPADPNAPLTGANHKRHRNFQINQPVFNASGRWQSEMGQEDRETFRSIANDELVALGYASPDWA